jgi:hypothetical protein
MELNIGSRLKRAWNAFTNRDPTGGYKSVGPGYSLSPSRPRLSRGNEKSIVNAVLTRIAMDAAAIDIKHCRLDKNGRYLEDVDSPLNDCFNLSANIDQTGRAFKLDIYLSLLDEGCIALVPIDTTDNPDDTNSYDINSMRVCRILDWYPQHVRVLAYNDRKGKKEELVMPKSQVAIIENPAYSVMNEPNSTMQRLKKKLSLLDATDEQSASGKLDLIIQLPYAVKSELKRQQVEERRKDIEDQLTNGKYGIAWADGTEKITQLNRPVENNLMKQIEYLTNLFYSQLGVTQSVMDGTADEKTMLNYNNRTIEPLVAAVVDEVKRKFLTKTARTKGQSISYFTDPFKLVPVDNIAEIADKFTRNEIMTSNEIRQIIGMKPSDDPKADQLINSNISQPNQGEELVVGDTENEERSEGQNGY